MTVPPFNELRLKPGEEPTQQRLEELFDGYMRNLEDAYERLSQFEKGLGIEAAYLKAAAGGNHKVAWGTSSLTFTASTASALKSVSHGLGIAPLVVLPVTFQAAAFGNLITFNVVAKEKTTFSVNGEIKTATTGNIPFDWFAIG